MGFESPRLRDFEHEPSPELPMPSVGQPAKPSREVSARWTEALVSQGWTPVADFFLDNYAKLEPPLTNAEAMLVIHLVRHKWDDAPPFPGFTTLARRMGISPTAARGHARSLEKKGYLVREMRVGTTNRFDLRKLFTALEKQQAFELGRQAGMAARPGRGRAAPKS
jgi:DNA-binding MarR family transcriptional regulator